MKYILIIGDGMADHPLEELNGKTPLQVAEHPNMDHIVSQGICGSLETIPVGLPLGTDVAILSILGYDPSKLQISRGPLEAASMGIKLSKDDLAFRCNFITVKNGILKDYSAGHIPTEDAREVLNCINEVYGRRGEIEFFAGIGYRHLLVLRGKKYSDEIICTPPHDALERPISEILPKKIDERGAKTVQILNDMIIGSKDILSSHPINRKRVGEGKEPANMIWPWGHGRMLNLKSFYEVYGLKGAVVSAVDVVNGIGAFTGMDIIRVPGVTGYYDTNYEGKADYALNSLKDHDFILIHVEAPDEASHVGDHKLKIKTIEDLDKRLIGRLLKNIAGDYTIAILSDHATLTDSRVHAREPVPFAIFSKNQINSNKVERFDEFSVKEESLGILKGKEFIHLFLGT